MRTLKLFAVPLLFACLFAAPVNAQAQSSPPTLEPMECPVSVPDNLEVECLMLTVPADYEDPGEGMLRLPVIIIHSRNADAAPDAFLYTSGGPGYSALSAVGSFSRSIFVEDRDVIIMEQRGNKYADPALTCDILAMEEEVPGHTPCLDSLKAHGVDLRHFSTANVVRDLAALRELLPYVSYNLHGSSYSTKVMLESLAFYPEGIRSLVLNGSAYPGKNRLEHDPEHQSRALDQLFADCEADAACAEAYPDLEADFYAVYSRLNADPAVVTLLNRTTGETYEIAVDGEKFFSWFFIDSFYKPATRDYPTAYLPLLITELADRNDAMLYGWVDDHVSGVVGDSPWAWGRYFVTSCMEDGGSADRAVIDAQIEAYPELEGYYRHRGELTICDTWGLDPVPVEPYELESDIPVLIIGGAYDPITPSEWGRAAAGDLENGTFIEIPSAGHNVRDGNGCVDQMMEAFIDDPVAQLDTGCMAEIPPVAFILPDEVLIAPDIYEVHYREVGFNRTEQNLLLAGLIALFPGMVYAVSMWITRLLKKAGKPEKPVRAAFLLGGLNGGLIILFALLFRYGLQREEMYLPLMLRFGLPSEFWPVMVLPLIITALLAVMAWLTVKLWIKKESSLLGRITLSLLAAGGAVIIGLLAHWGLLFAVFR